MTLANESWEEATGDRMFYGGYNAISVVSLSLKSLVSEDRRVPKELIFYVDFPGLLMVNVGWDMQLVDHPAFTLSAVPTAGASLPSLIFGALFGAMGGQNGTNDSSGGDEDDEWGQVQGALEETREETTEDGPVPVGNYLVAQLGMQLPCAVHITDRATLYASPSLRYVFLTARHTALFAGGNVGYKLGRRWGVLAETGYHKDLLSDGDLFLVQDGLFLAFKRQAAWLARRNHRGRRAIAWPAPRLPAAR